MSSNTLSSATCGLCSELYTDPRMLQCLHSFCSKCLDRIAEEQGSETSLKCPTCQKTASIPEGGVHAIQKDLRKNYEADVAKFASCVHSEREKCCDMCIDTSSGNAVSYCLNCSDFLCKSCSEYHKKCRKTVDHKLEPVHGSKSKSLRLTEIPHKPANCQLHENEILKFYCETCSSLVCCDCMTTKHTGHTYNPIERVVDKERADMLSVLESTNIDRIKAKLDEAIAKGSKIMQEVQGNSQKPIEELIENAFTTLTDALLKRHKDVLAKVGSIRTDLEVQGKEFKMLRKEIIETCEMITAAVHTYTSAEMLSSKGALTNKLKQLLMQYQEINLEPCRSDKISSRFETSELAERVSSFGLIVVGSYPKKAETDFYIQGATVGKERKITIVTYDIHGKRFPYGGERVNVMLSLTYPQLNNIEGQVKDNNDGTYVVSLTPQIAGEKQELSITFDGEHIKGSPFKVEVRSAINYQQLVHSNPVFHSSNPYDVAVDDTGDVYVVSYTSGVIEVFNSYEHPIRKIGLINVQGENRYSQNRYQHHYTVPSTTGYFHSPSAIAVKSNKLYIAEEKQHCVQIFTTSGEFMSKFGTQGSGDGELNQPRGLCIHNDGRVFVSDAGNKRISVFDAYGTFLYHIPNDSGHSNFSSPWGIALDHHGSLHIGDSSSIQVFTSEGKYISEYNSHICSPAGIAIDAEGSTLLADSDYYPSYRDGAREWSVSNSKHQVVHSLKNPSCTGITIDKNGVIYLSNYEESKVYIY